MERFLNFVKTTLQQNPQLPATKEQVSLYVAYLHTKNYRHTTILSHLSAISHFHKMKDLHDPVATYSIGKLMTGVQNTQPSRFDERLPITKYILIGLITALKCCAPSTYEILLYTSMYSLMYYGCLRASEVMMSDSPHHNLEVKNVVMAGTSFTVTFTSFKHCKERGNTIQMDTTASPDCPVQAMKQYLQARGDTPGPLFIHKWRAVNRAAFLDTLQKCLQYLNISADRYNTHSFRIGRTTEMAERGVPDHIIQQIGRWKSRAYLKYIRPQHIKAQPQVSMMRHPGQPSSC